MPTRLQMDDQEAVMNRRARKDRLRDFGWCGIARGVGCKKQKYVLSVSIGEQELLPAIRPATQHALIIADGFSCREPIAQMPQRRQTNAGGMTSQRSTRA